MTKPGVLLIYCRQSKTDLDQEGNVIGVSLHQQLDSIIRKPEFQGMTFERFTDANLSGKETTKRPGYNAVMNRVRTAVSGEIAGIAAYDQSRLHRDTMNFLLFMVECEQRHIPVYDAAGLVAQSEKLTWTIKAAVATDERERIAKRVTDNLAFLKRNGRLLGHEPAGYLREGGKLVIDPVAAPIVQRIFTEYASGRYSFNTLAAYLNSIGVKPPRGDSRTWHNRPTALIFTPGVLKDLLRSVSYTGQVQLTDGTLVPGQHPALVTKETFAACEAIRLRNRRRMTRTFRRYSYPLAPVLVCGRCGGKMNGESSGRGESSKLYYACAHRRRQLARVEFQSCTAPYIPAPDLEAAVVTELRAAVLDAGLTEALLQGIAKAPRPKRVTATALRRIDEQISRVKDLYELGLHDRDTMLAKTGALNVEKVKLREAAQAQKAEPDLDWCEVALRDTLAAWELANAGERAGMLDRIFGQIEAEKFADGRISVVAVPKANWWPYFQQVVNSRAKGTGTKRETRLELATSTLGRLRSTN
jgi:DNA invertase Pin-like site-specific DNA recombinase